MREEEMDQSIEIKTRIDKAKSTFIRMKSIFTRKILELSLRVRLGWCYIMPVLLYGMESWMLSQKLEKSIEAIEMFIYRHLLKITCRDKVSNEEVWRRIMSKEWELLNTMKECKLQYQGHIHRNEKYKVFQAARATDLIGIYESDNGRKGE